MQRQNLMFRRNSKTAVLFLLALTALACVPTFAPAPTPLPTFDPNSLYTEIAQTANAAATQTQMFITPSATPTFTPPPTKTPSETPTPSPTFIFILPTATPSEQPFGVNKPAGTDYACTLLAQSPQDNSLIPAGSLFSVRWQVQNTGKLAWEGQNVDFLYASGTKMHMQPAYDLYKNVAPGEIVDLIVDMKAPGDPGLYTTKWRLRSGKTYFCSVSVTVNVK